MYDNVTSWDSHFSVWTFNVTDGPLPNFVIRSKKKFSISVKNVTSENILSITKLLRKYGDRIVKINFEIGSEYPNSFEIKFFKELHKIAPSWRNLREITLGKMLWENCQFQVMFRGCQSVLTKLSLTTYVFSSCEYQYFHLTNLKSLSLSFCQVDSRILVPLATNLKHLHLSFMRKFDLTALEETSTTFHSLKSLKLKNCGINIAKFLAKCCDSLEELEIVGRTAYCDGSPPKLTRLTKLSILCSNLNIAELLAKCCHSLQHLKIAQYKWLRIENLKGCKFLDLKSLEIMNGSGTNIVKFISLTCETLESLELVTLTSQIDFSMFKRIKMRKLRRVKISFGMKLVKNVDTFLKNCPRIYSLSIVFGYFALFFDIMCLKYKNGPQQMIPIQPASYFSLNLQSMLAATQATLRHLNIINRCFAENLATNLEYLGRN